MNLGNKYAGGQVTHEVDPWYPYKGRTYFDKELNKNYTNTYWSFILRCFYN